jgi:hypothetical protein
VGAHRFKCRKWLGEQVSPAYRHVVSQSTPTPLRRITTPGGSGGGEPLSSISELQPLPPAVSQQVRAPCPSGARRNASACGHYLIVTVVDRRARAGPFSTQPKNYPSSCPLGRISGPGVTGRPGRVIARP